MPSSICATIPNSPTSWKCSSAKAYKIMPLTATFSSNGDSAEAEDAVTPLED